jgi:hypothetical protein
LVGQANHTNNMNRSILKQLNKNLNKHYYVRKIKSGEVFYGVQLTTVLASNDDVIGATSHSQLKIGEDGKIEITDRDKGFSSKQLNDTDNFIVKLEVKPKLTQNEDYTFSVKVNDIEIIEDENGNPGIKVTTQALNPVWIDGESEYFQSLQSKSIERVTDDVLEIIVNSSDLEFSSVHYDGSGKYIDLLDRNQLIKDLPKI